MCVRLGELRGEAPRVSQEETGVERTSIRVLASSHQPVPSTTPPVPLGIQTPGTATPEDAPQRGGVRVLPSTPFRLTLAPPLCAPALLGQLGWETCTPSTLNPPRRQEGGDTVVSAAYPIAYCP